MGKETVELVLTAWRTVTRVVAGAPADFVGRDKETRVFRRLRDEIAAAAPSLQLSGPDFQIRFNRWGIDLVCHAGDCRIAVEGKYKIRTDGAVPDNRKAAFFDLFKLEQYVDSGEYDVGLFLWLTDEPAYRKRATGDSLDFSTHQGRLYAPGTPLRAMRSRNAMPIPLVLKRAIMFNWQAVDSVGAWCRLAIQVERSAA
jgi:hypothetical protein